MSDFIEFLRISLAHKDYYISFCILSQHFYYPGTIAQLGEHLPYKQGVTGSSPVGPTIKNNAAW